jgi:hypothetical protein
MLALISSERDSIIGVAVLLAELNVPIRDIKAKIFETWRRL